MQPTNPCGGRSRLPFNTSIQYSLPAVLEAVLLVRNSGKRQVEFGFPSEPGLKAQVYSSGRVVFYTRYYYQGQRPRKQHGELGEITLDRVRQAHILTLQQLSSGQNPQQTNQKAVARTFGELFENHYVPQCRARDKRSLKSDMSRYEHWLKPAFGNLPLADISNTAVSELVMSMREHGLAPSTINKVVSTLTACLNVAVDMDILTKSPVKFKPLRVNNRRTEFMTVKELSAFIATAKACESDEFVGARLLMLLALTGARLGEGLAARWEDMNIETGVWRLPTQKSGKPGLIHLSTAACEVVAELASVRANEFVVPGVRGNSQLSRPIKLFKRICHRAGLGERWRIHDLRHGWISAGIFAGVPIEIVSQAARHSSPNVTRIYSHPYLESLVALNETVASLISG